MALEAAVGVVLGTGLAVAGGAPPDPSTPSGTSTVSAAPDAAAGTDAGWPVTVVVQGWLLHVEHPQWTQWDGSHLHGRVVLRLSTTAPLGDAQADAPTAQAVGVAWIDATVEADDDALAVGTVAVTQLVIPGATVAQSDTIADGLRDCLPSILQGESVHAVHAAVDLAQSHAAAAAIPAPLPAIRIATTPTALVLLAGEPQFQPLGDHGRFQRVVNTPSALLQDRQGNAWWLLLGGRWYTAATLHGRWRAVEAVPPAIDHWTHDPALAAGARSGSTPMPPEAIEVATSPTELVVLDGPPRLTAIPGTNLALVVNADHRLFRRGADGPLYLLASGRWLRVTGATGDPGQVLATLRDGHWQAQPASELPPDFARLPAATFADVRASVPGTTEAEEAVVAAQVPVLARVPRQATAQVHWQGAPAFTPIPGTTLAYATTSDTPVIRVGAQGPYYTLQQGVWYIADSPQGPWTVATSTPPDLAAIPPSSPVYGCNAVTVYEVEPDWVVDGYDAPYLGAYVLDGCVVWGTGYTYPCTGFGVCLGPWTWGFNMCYWPRVGWWAPWGWHGGGRWEGFGHRPFFRSSLAARTISGRSGWLGPVGVAPVRLARDGAHRGTPLLYGRDGRADRLGVEPLGTRVSPAMNARLRASSTVAATQGWRSPPSTVLRREGSPGTGTTGMDGGRRESPRALAPERFGGSSSGTLGSTERMGPERIAPERVGPERLAPDRSPWLREEPGLRDRAPLREETPMRQETPMRESPATRETAPAWRSAPRSAGPARSSGWGGGHAAGHSGGRGGSSRR